MTALTPSVAGEKKRPIGRVMRPEVSVVVPTYRRPDLLRRCLAALMDQDIPERSLEIVIADDAAEEATRRLVETMAAASRFPIRYVAVEGPHGPSAARNAGWRAARAPLIAFTDDDCVPDKSWARAGLAAMKAFPEAVAMRGRLVMPLPEVPTDYELNASGLASAPFVTANCFCRRAALDRLGGFDETFTKAWREDSDLHFRLLDRGPVGAADDALVVHPVRPAAWGISLRQQRNNFFEALLYRKHPRRYREVLGERPPWRYYAIVGSAAGAIVSAALGRRSPAAVFAGAWTLLTTAFFARRLRGTARTRAHIWEMAVTSAAIPPLALFWRWRGALRHRVFFL